MTQTLTEFITAFEEKVPPYLAEKDDVAGLQIGALSQPVQKIMVTLDIRPEVVEEAIAKEIDLIIAKHAIIFRGVKTLTDQDPQTQMYRQLIQADIAVYVAHTNMDIMENGLNDLFCEKIGLKNPVFLTQTHAFPLFKLAVYVPFSEATPVREAAYRAGAGTLSANYSECSFSVQGTGRFKPEGTAQPTLGEMNQLTKVSEERVEMLVRQRDCREVIEAIQAAHPYEEPAIDLVRLENQVEEYGIGRIGLLETPMTVRAFAHHLKETLGVPALRMISQDPEQTIQKVAICGGSGEKFYPDALTKGADVFITGDVYYHTAHDMLAAGLHVLDPGHYIEVHAKTWLEKILKQLSQEKNWKLTIEQSLINTNPFQEIN